MIHDLCVNKAPVSRDYTNGMDEFTLMDFINVRKATDNFDGTLL